jgi:hypothetical protein
LLQASVPNISSVFLDVYCKCVYLDVVYISHYAASVLSECCIYFTMAFHVFSDIFASVSDVYFKCFIFFIRMLQVLRLDVSKVDRVLHMFQ